VGLVVARALGLVLNWVAFFPGPGEFQSSASILRVSVSHGTTAAVTGRWLFSAFALLLDGVRAGAMWRLLETLSGRARGGA
jgi:hypothetical protein